MRRTFVHLTLLTLLALIAAPAAPEATSGIDRPAAVDPCPLGTCGERGPVSDPNGAPLRSDFLRA